MEKTKKIKKKKIKVNLFLNQWIHEKKIVEKGFIMSHKIQKVHKETPKSYLVKCHINKKNRIDEKYSTSIWIPKKSIILYDYKKEFKKGEKSGKAGHNN